MSASVYGVAYGVESGGVDDVWLCVEDAGAG